MVSLDYTEDRMGRRAGGTRVDWSDRASRETKRWREATRNWKGQRILRHDQEEDRKRGRLRFKECMCRRLMWLSMFERMSVRGGSRRRRRIDNGENEDRTDGGEQRRVGEFERDRERAHASPPAVLRNACACLLYWCPRRGKIEKGAPESKSSVHLRILLLQSL